MNRDAAVIRTPSIDRPARKQPFTDTSSTAETHVEDDCGSASGGWYTFVPTQDCHIIWGDADVADADTDEMFYAAGVEFSRWLSAADDSHLSVIRAGADSGALYWHKSES